MLDPTSNLYLEKNGVPLNAFEIRQEWFYRDGVDLDFVVGTKRKIGLGTNRMEARTINKFGIAGPVSIAEVELADAKVNNTPLCNLYVSMLQRLGVESDSFGSSTGTLTGLDG